jgi:hypothetical protein
MIKKLFHQKFEHIIDVDLPPKARRILESVIRDFLSVGGDSIKQVEIAHAVLHMRLYQHFGHASPAIVARADKALSDMAAAQSARAAQLLEAVGSEEIGGGAFAQPPSLVRR